MNAELSSSRFSPIGYFFIDRKGRRFLLMVSLAAMVPLLIATGFSFDANSDSAQLGVVGTFVILFTLAYRPGAGVVPFLYSSEIFPQVLRGKYYNLSLIEPRFCIYRLTFKTWV